MIQRIFILLLVIILLPDIYGFRRPGRQARASHAARCCSLGFSVMMCVYTLGLAAVPSFAPRDMAWLTVYLSLLGVVVVPRFLIFLCCLAGTFISKAKWCSGHAPLIRRAALSIGVVLAAGIVFITVYGRNAGFSALAVNSFEYQSEDIPAAFDGYRIVLFSDAHVGSYIGADTCILARAVDSIEAQRPDMVVFAGDMQNMRPAEIAPVRGILARVGARDGVYSVLGNHDYSEYIKADSAECRRNERMLIEAERSLGWDLLIDENRIIRRGDDSIVVAGMENVSEKPFFKDKGDMEKTLAGVAPGAFVIMVQHDPRAWRSRILPECKAQLTLSGHTHGGQIKLFGWTPVSLTYSEWGGMYAAADGRALYVSTGLGGFVPFRFGLPGEIVVITLRSSRR